MRAVTLLSLLLPALLKAQTAAVPNHIRYTPTYDEVRSDLGLSDAQLNDLRQMQQDRMSASQVFYQKMGDKQKELNSLLENKSTDATRIGQAMLDLQTLRRLPPPAMDDMHDRAVTLLTPQQNAKLKVLEESLALRPAADQAIQLGLLSAPPMAPRVMPVPQPTEVTGPGKMAPMAHPAVKK